MTPLEGLPRLWPTIDLPGIAARGRTYWTLDLEALPKIEAPLDGTLAWLLDSPAHRVSLERGPDDPAERDADPAGLRAVTSSSRLPVTFRRFIEDPEPRRHVRSATACFLDLGQFAVSVAGGGELIHFLSDQQWVLHWLLYAGPDGAEAVVATPSHLGFDVDLDGPVRVLDADTLASSAAVCADSFEEFLYRYWAMNELFFRLAVDRTPLEMLPGELRRYAERYPRTPSARDIFASVR